MGTRGADEMFARRFCLVEIGTVLFPTSAAFVKQLFIPVVSDVSNISKTNWASSCVGVLVGVGVLVDSIRRFELRSNKYMLGCTLFLEVSIHGQ